MTNPHTSQIGIYKLPKKFIAFEMGYSQDTVNSLIDRFRNKYKNILYSDKTQEVSLLNSLKYSIVKGGKPVEDLLKKEINKVSDTQLIVDTYNALASHWEISNKPFDETVMKIFEHEILKRQTPSLNDNDNDNDNEESYPDSCDDSYPDSPKMSYQAIADSFIRHCPKMPAIKKLTSARIKTLKAWGNVTEMEEVFEKAGKSDFLNGGYGKWTASFDWIIQPKNRIKILEGNYDNKPKADDLKEITFLSIPEDQYE